MKKLLIFIFLGSSFFLNGIDLELKEIRTFHSEMLLFLIVDKDTGKKEVVHLAYEDFNYSNIMNNLNPYVLYVQLHQFRLSRDVAKSFFSDFDFSEENYGISINDSR